MGIEKPTIGARGARFHATEQAGAEKITGNPGGMGKAACPGVHWVLFGNATARTDTRPGGRPPRSSPTSAAPPSPEVRQHVRGVGSKSLH